LRSRSVAGARQLGVDHRELVLGLVARLDQVLVLLGEPRPRRHDARDLDAVLAEQLVEPLLGAILGLGEARRVGHADRRLAAELVAQDRPRVRQHPLVVRVAHPGVAQGLVGVVRDQVEQQRGVVEHEARAVRRPDVELADLERALVVLAAQMERLG